MSDKFITIKEASQKLGVSRATLRNWDNTLKLKAYRHPINNYRVYKIEDIEKILSQIKDSAFLIRTPRKSTRKLYVRQDKSD
jgi:DNA-binding transcriptional MerR regulator